MTRYRMDALYYRAGVVYVHHVSLNFRSMKAALKLARFYGRGLDAQWTITRKCIGQEDVVLAWNRR